MPLSAADIIKELSRIRGSIEQDVLPSMNQGEEAGGYFSSIRLIFCYIDVFGYFYCNKPGSKSAVSFISNFMGRDLVRYREIPGLIYSIYRHGTVHNFKPKGFIINGNRYANVVAKDTDIISGTDDLRFTFKRLFNDTPFTHLTPLKMKPINSDARFNHIEYWWPCSTPRLYRDLLRGVDHFISDVKKDSTLCTQVGKALQVYLKPYEFYYDRTNSCVYEKHPNGKKEERKYINVSEFTNF